MFYIDKFYAPADEDCGCADNCECEEVMSQEELEELFADSEMLEIESEDGEKLEFFVVDDFEYQDHDYLVLMSREEPFGYFIVRETVEDEESYLDTLEEAEEPAVYEFYEALLDAAEEDDCCCSDEADGCCQDKE
ncbi:MAG: DUF1292 domain-containing protein [Eubacteriales bacterium]|nr:DUF1292 domain-containing protein [Eubacteriales bacterium]